MELPIASSGPRLVKEAIRLLVPFRMGLNPTAARTCRWGLIVDARSQLSLICKLAPNRIPNINWTIWWVEPWCRCSRKSLTWDVTFVSKLADSYIASAGSMTCWGDRRLRRNARNSFQSPLDSVNYSAYHFLEDLGCRISDASGDSREGSFIFQGLSVTIQRFSLVRLLLGTTFRTLVIPHLFKIFFVLTHPWLRGRRDGAAGRASDQRLRGRRFHSHHSDSPSPPLDNIRVMVICWRLRGNIIRTALCWIVWHNVHSPQHTYVSSCYRSNRLGLSHWDPYAVRRGGCLELYYCNMVEWFWWDSSLISTTNWFP